MIEALTPQIMMIALLLVSVLPALLTLVLSLLLLWRYRVALERRMRQASGGELSVPDSAGGGILSSPVAEEAVAGSGERVYRWLQLRSLRAAGEFTVALLPFALICTAAAQFVYPSQIGAAGALIALSVYLWPAVLGVWLILPASHAYRYAWAPLYLLLFASAGWIGAQIHDQPAYSFGGVDLSARSTLTPVTLAKLWLVVNLPPTLLIWLCLNRWLRAVAPLLLALTTTLIGGLVIVYFAVFSSTGVEFYVALSAASGLHPLWFLVLTLVAALLLFGLSGWRLTSSVVRAYRRGGTSDRALMLDAVVLLFANYYGLWLSAGGALWYLTVPLAFLFYRLAQRTMQRGRNRPFSTRGLVFLRVFASGARSDRLLNELAAYWRYLGGVRLITGPDTAQSTLQPHQFLDYLSGRLASHFITDDHRMERELQQMQHAADPDGRFRINNFFCYRDTWQGLVARLVAGGDLVLMDLRDFKPDNDGCIHELHLLVRTVPLSRFVLVVGSGTDRVFLKTTLDRAWKQLQPGEVNSGSRPEQIRRVELREGGRSLRRLLRTLCDAG